MDIEQMLVADLMTIDPVTVPVDAPLEVAAHLCRANGITGLPVTDEAGALLGVISQTDLVSIQDSPLGRLIRTEPSGLRVGELMTSPAGHGADDGLLARGGATHARWADPQARSARRQGTPGRRVVVV
jgi:CBS domain-containing protein